MILSRLRPTQYFSLVCFAITDRLLPRVPPGQFVRFLSAPGGGVADPRSRRGARRMRGGGRAAGPSLGLSFPVERGARGVHAPDSAHVEPRVSACPASLSPFFRSTFLHPIPFSPALLGGYRISSLSLSLSRWPTGSRFPWPFILV